MDIIDSAQCTIKVPTGMTITITFTLDKNMVLHTQSKHYGSTGVLNTLFSPTTQAQQDLNNLWDMYSLSKITMKIWNEIKRLVNIIDNEKPDISGHKRYQLLNKFIPKIDKIIFSSKTQPSKFTLIFIDNTKIILSVDYSREEILYKSGTGIAKEFEDTLFDRRGHLYGGDYNTMRYLYNKALKLNKVISEVLNSDKPITKIIENISFTGTVDYIGEDFILEVHKNPSPFKLKKDILRGVIMPNGDMYVLNFGGLVHIHLLELMAKEGLIPNSDYYVRTFIGFLKLFLTVKLKGNEVYLGDSYDSPDLKVWRLKIKDYIDKAEKKNPLFTFTAEQNYFL